MLVELFITMLILALVSAALNKYPKASGVVTFFASIIPFLAVISWSKDVGLNFAPRFLDFITLEKSLHYNIGIATLVLKITPLGWFFLLLLASVLPMAILFSISFIRKNPGGFYAAMIISMIGSMGILLAQDILSFYLFWEIMSWSILALVLRSHNKKAIMSYLSFGVLSAMLILLGIMILYGETGTFIFSEMGFMANNLTLIAISLLVAGFAVKGVLIPMHVWAPHVYSRSEEPFVAFLSGGLSKLGYFATILFMYGVVSISIINSWGMFRDVSLFGYTIAFIGALTAFIGTVLAVMQDDLRKLLAYSSIGQLGYIAIGIGIGTPIAMTGALFQAFNHTFFKSALFLAAGAVYYRTGKWRISELGGLGYKMPFTFLAALFSVFALAGIPITSGFAAKWLLYEAAIQKKFLFITPIMLISGVGAFLYSYRILYGVFLGEPRHDVKEAPISQLVAIWILVLPLIIFLIFPGWFVDLTAPALKWFGLMPVAHTPYVITTSLAAYNTLAVIFALIGGLILAFALYLSKPQKVVPHIDNYLAGEPPELYDYISMHAASRYYQPFEDVFYPIFKRGAEKCWLAILKGVKVIGEGARAIYTGIVNDYSIYILLLFLLLVGWWLIW